jgi:hypothetical protein
MTLGEDVVGSDDNDIGDDSTFKLSLSIDDLVTEVDELTIALASQDKLLRPMAREKKEYKYKYEAMLREFESATTFGVVFDETGYNECALHISNTTTLHIKYATRLDACDKLQSRSILFGACQTCPSLQTELAKITSFERASSVSAPVPLFSFTNSHQSVEVD